jgi:transcriptional regulator with XRE-family HTH domain
MLYSRMAIGDSFGARLRTARKRAGLNQTELAERVGVTRQTVTKWEREHRLMRPSALPRIAEALGVTTDELFPQELPRTGTSDRERIARLEQELRDLRAELLERELIAPTPSELATRLELVADEYDRQDDEQHAASDESRTGRQP